MAKYSKHKLFEIHVSTIANFFFMPFLISLVEKSLLPALMPPAVLTLNTGRGEGGSYTPVGVCLLWPLPGLYLLLVTQRMGDFSPQRRGLSHSSPRFSSPPVTSPRSFNEV